MKIYWINFGVRIDPETEEERKALSLLLKSARYVDFKEELRLLRLANEAKDAARASVDAELQRAGMTANDVTGNTV